MVIFAPANKLEGKVGKGISISASHKILDSLDQESISLGVFCSQSSFCLFNSGQVFKANDLP